MNQNAINYFEAKWFVQVGQAYQGPMSSEEAIQLIQSGAAGTRPLVWTKGFDVWIHYDESPIYTPPKATPLTIEDVPPELPAPFSPTQVEKVSPSPKVIPFNRQSNASESNTPVSIVIRSENDLTLFKEIEARPFDDRTAAIDKKVLKQAIHHSQKLGIKSSKSKLVFFLAFGILFLSVVIWFSTKVK